ncbi:unnamed protein product [Lymnaea stagnalis]|uniref:Uncharacterized protein n=1 Tax=Lymnaea stagnalis TaxID=6523 RepID=A0AAV2HMI5_LYMST
MIVKNSLSILAFAVSCLKCQLITLFDFKQEDSQSQCSKGLISGFDVVVFKCHVDYSEDTAMKYVTFQVKKTSYTKFTFFTDCNIQEDCKNSTNINGIHIDKFVIELTVSLNATKSLSGAKLRGILYTSDNMKIMSNEKFLPEISDHTEASGQLIVNGKNINSSDECRESISRSELFIVFLCESNVVPCLIEISTNDSTEIVHGKGHATWKGDYIFPQEVGVLVKYAICRLNGPSQNFNCKFIIDLKETISNPEENDGSKFNTTVIIVVVNAVPMLLLLCLLLSYIMYKQCRPNIDRKKNHHSCGEEVFLDLLDDKQTTNETAKKIILSTNKPYMVTDNLMEDFKTCPKNKCHNRFIPMGKFTEQHLPRIHQSNNVFHLMKIVADLTVKVKVSYVSDGRPEFFKDTDHPYPFYDKRKDNVTLRFGTGLIKHVVFMTEEDGPKCQCHKCLHSDEAGKIRGKIYISTAQSLVFDDSEALKTTFQICFDELNGPYHCINGLRVTKCNIIDDQCLVECVTCQKSLLNSLELKTTNCIQEMADANSKYNNSKVKDNMTIMVSHPHGCPKHVSIGHWTNRLIVRTEDSIKYTKYAYTTPTCPGSIGAFVYILGVSDILLNHHMHCGVKETVHGFSGTGME